VVNSKSNAPLDVKLDSNDTARNKYPLAAAEAVMDAYGPNTTIGFDTGCRFRKSVAKSPLGPKARANSLFVVVGTFHGHAHNRRCQLDHLPTYLKGLGLSDLEMCERFFGKSNALASHVRHASVFHRRQKIVEHARQVDRFEISQSISMWPSIACAAETEIFQGEIICKLYKRVLDLLKGESTLLKTMEAREISDYATFHTWLAEEKAYLMQLQHEPPEEAIQMDYYQALVNYGECE
jgi:Kyakuja-Dileera-Zisupton transposase